MIRNLRELYQYRALLWSLTQRELRARYRGSVLGFLWTFLNPTLLMLVYALVFGVYLKQTIPFYTYFVFVGLLPWIWFSSSVAAGTGAISERRDLLTKVRFPPQILPATVVATNLCNYLLALPLMIALGAIYGIWPTWHSLSFIVILLVQLVFTLALAYAVSALNVSFRDLQYIVANLLTLWFFITPVLYLNTSIPPQFRTLMFFGNPMAVIISSYQSVFYAHQLPDPAPLAGVFVTSVALLWISSRVFEVYRDGFAELV
jgi:lipopolysaccharide transport system permease protein